MSYGQPPAGGSGGSGSGYTPPPSGGGYTPPPAGGGYNPPPSGGGYNPPPGGGGGYAPPPPVPPGGGGYSVASGGTNVLAIISLVAGIIALLSLCTFFGAIPLIIGIIATVLGFMGRNQIRQRGQGGNGLAMAGLILGIVSIVLGLLELAGLAALVGLAPQLATVIATLTPGQ